jgi:hypothetical protein
MPNEAIMLSTAYTNAVQNIHLLSNPGIGIPSDLWVPALDGLAPETIDHYSIDARKNFKGGWQISGAWFTKKMKNQLEFDIPTDLFVNILNQENIIPSFTNQNDWLNRVKTGVGNVKGFEFMVSKDEGKLKGWLSFSRIISTRMFQDIDKGSSFAAKYSRPYDANVGITYDINKKWSAGLNFVYSSGTYFTFPNEVFTSILGVNLIKPDGRNNYQLPAFHQLSVSSDFKFSLKKMKCKLGFGIYNVYNRLNTYFVYSIRNETNEPLLRKVSVFPFLPHLNFSIEIN